MMGQIKSTEKAEKAPESPSPARTSAAPPAPFVSPEVPGGLNVQQAVGNLAMQRLLRSGGIQANLTVNQPGDMYEQEADRTADHVVRPLRTKSPADHIAPRVPNKREGGSEALPADRNSMREVPPWVIANQGHGMPLNTVTRDALEARMETDLSGVRVHNDAAAHEAARSLNARAFTYQNDIWLGEGESDRDLHLMAHEAAHVVQQNGQTGMLQRSNGGGTPPAPSPPPAGGAPAAPAPGTPSAPIPAPAPGGGGPVPTPAGAPPATRPSSTTEIVVPPFTLFDAEEKTHPLFDLPIIDKVLWGALIELPPPLFAATASIRARVGLKMELFLRYGPAVLRDIRLALDPSGNRYSGAAQFYLPVAAGPRAILTGSLIGSVDWLGLVETLAIEGGLRAIGQAPLILAISPSVNVIYDAGSFTFNLRPQIDAGFALIFDLNAFAEARVLGDKVWEKTWNLFHWHWGRAVRMGTSLSLDYISGGLQPVRVEPFAERISIDEVLEGMKTPAEGGSLTVIPPGRRPLDERLRELLGTSSSDPQVILATLAEADDREKAALQGDQATMSALQGALGNSLWPIAQRILTNAPSETVPSLDEGSLFLANRHIRVGRFQDALHVVVSKLQARGIIDGNLATFAYARGTTSGEGLTTTSYDKDPVTGVRTPRGPSTVEIYDPAFVNVPWLYSTIMHEYVHVLQFQQNISAAEFTDPEWPVRREVEAYLWEIEHARGSGVIASPQQMTEIGRRLTDHFNQLSPASQLRYRDRYDAAMTRVRDAASGILPVNVTYSVADARRIVQESSQRIAELVRRRPDPGKRPPTPDEKAEQERIDREIAAIQRERSEALVEVVLAENPNVQIVDRARGIYRVPITDGSGRVQWVSGSISVVWHLQQLSPDVFSLGAVIRSRPPATLPPGTSVSSHLLVGGSGIQSTVQPFPGDIDFSEEFEIVAPDENAAGAAMAEIIAEFVGRTSTDPNLEFVTLRVMPAKEDPGTNYKWDQARILDGGQRAELARQLAGSGGGRVNTDWRALVQGGRYIEITKMLSIHAMSSVTGKELLATQPLGTEFQEAYLDEVPPEVEQMPLGEYASLMRKLAIKEADSGNYLKAAKRAFNYFRAIGNLEAMAAVTPIFATVEARINQHVAVLEAISKALKPATPTRILTADTARARLHDAADLIETSLPTLPGRGKWIADELRSIAAAIRARDTEPIGMVVPDADLAERLDSMVKLEIKAALNSSLQDRVQPIIDRYVR